MPPRGHHPRAGIRRDVRRRNLDRVVIMNWNEFYKILRAFHQECIKYGYIKSALIQHTSEFDGTPQTSFHVTFADGNKASIAYIATGSMVGIVSEVK